MTKRPEAKHGFLHWLRGGLPFNKYKGPTDWELVLFCFLAFLNPLGAFFVWPDQAKEVRAMVLFLIVGAAIAASYGFAISRFNCGMRNQLEEQLRRGAKEGPAIGESSLAGGAGSVLFVGATVTLSAYVGIPWKAWSWVWVIVLIYATMLAVIPAMYMVFHEWSWRQRNGSLQLSPDTLKERLDSFRTIFNFGGLLAISLTAAAVFSFDKVLQLVGFSGPEGLVANPAATRAAVWVFAGMALAILSLVFLFLTRVIDLYLLLEAGLQRIHRRTS